MNEEYNKLEYTEHSSVVALRFHIQEFCILSERSSTLIGMLHDFPQFLQEHVGIVVPWNRPGSLYCLLYCGLCIVS